MKICIVSNSHPTNDVRLYYKLGISLAKRGEVYIISTKGMVNNTSNPYQRVVDATSPLKALPLLYQEIKKIQPDLLICVEPLTMICAFFVQKNMKRPQSHESGEQHPKNIANPASDRVKVIFDIHEFFADAFAERFSFVLRPFARMFYMIALRRLASIADAFTCVNQDILNQLLGKKAKDERCLVLPNYPVKNVWDYQCDVPGALSQLCDMHFDLIYAGGLTKDRGVFKILKCASLLKNEFPRLSILILGKFHDQNVEDEFNRSINDYNLNAIIYYQEWIPAEKIGLLLKRSRFGLWLFNPKIKRMSLATPLKVLEYLAAGLPVISIKTPLMKSLIERNNLGSLSSFSSQDIAKNIAKMLRLPQAEYTAMSQRCEEISETRFNWESLEPKLFEQVQKVLS